MPDIAHRCSLPPLLLLLLLGALLPSSLTAGCGGDRRRGGSGSAEGEGEGGGGEGEGEGHDGRDLGPAGDGGVDLGLPDGGHPDLGPAPCSPQRPDGVCATPGETCLGGTCTPPACSPAQPTGDCAGELICVDGECLPPPCDAAHPHGRCADGEVCQAGTCQPARLRLVALTLLADGPVPGEPPGPGAGNGIADAGETLALQLEVQNLGDTSYLSLAGTISSEDPAVATVPAATATQAFSDLTAGGRATAQVPFTVRLAEALPDGAVAPLRVRFVDSRQGELDTLLLRVGVRQGLLLGAAGMFIDDDALGASAGNGDHRLDPGERIELQLDLLNRGTLPLPPAALPGDLVSPALDASWIALRLGSPTATLAIVPADPPAPFLGALAAGAVAEAVAEWTVQVDPAAAPDQHACLALTLLLGVGAPPSAGEDPADSARYRFEELRCFPLGQAPGPLCTAQPEQCNDEDDDCNGLIDDGLPLNACGRCGAAPLELCNAVDDDCDQLTDEELQAPAGTCPGRGVCRQAEPECRGAAGWRCRFPDSWEDATETSCDGLDNDCDGQTDEALAPPAGQCPGRGVCAGLQAGCQGAQGWLCPWPATHEASPEASCDGLDNDCDGQTDEALPPPVGLCPTRGVCTLAQPACRGGQGWACIFPASHEQVEASCDGLDNDCDGQTDEGLAGPPGVCPERGVCLGAVAACRGQSGWACSYPATHESGAERSCDGLDNDCDGQTDEALTPPAGLSCAAVGVCQGTAPRCLAAQGWDCGYPPTYQPTEQACDDLDNDCDGQTDEELPLNACGHCGPLPVGGCGEGCADATPLLFAADGSATAQGSTVGMRDDAGGSCGGSGAPDQVYRFHLDQPRTAVTFSLDGHHDQADEWDTLIYLRSGDCSAAGSVACDDDGNGGVGTSDISLGELPPGDHYLFIDGYDSQSGPFDLHVQLGPAPAVPANDSCAGALASSLSLASPSVTLVGAVGAARNDLPASSCLPLADGGSDLVYRLELGQRLALSVKALATDLGPVGLQLLATACSGAARRETACAAPPAGGGPTTLRHAGLDAGSYWLVVDGATATSHRFQLELSVWPPAQAPINETCASAAELSWSAGQDGLQRAAGVGNLELAQDQLRPSCAGAGGGDVVHHLTLHEERALVVVPGPAPWGHPVFAVSDSACSGATAHEQACLADGQPQVIARAAAGDHWLIADTTGAQQGGPYSFEITAYPPVPAADGTCAAPLPLPLTGARTLVFGDTTGAPSVLPGAGACGADGPEQVYAFHLDEPRGPSTLRVQSLDFARWDTVLTLLRGGCSADREPVACDDDLTPGASQIDLTRLAAGDYFLIVEGYAAQDAGYFQLTVDLGEPLLPPANDTCAGATLLGLEPDGRPLVLDGATAAAGPDLAPPQSCPLAASLGGGDVVYQLDLPRPLMLDAVAEPLDDGGVALQLVGGACGGEGATELACAEQEFVASTLRLPRLEAGRYWLVVRGSTADADRFQLTLTGYPPAGQATNETCALAQPLAWPAPVDGVSRLPLVGNASGSADDLVSACGGAGAADLVYALHLDAPAALQLQLDAPDLGTQAAVLYGSGCGPGGQETLCVGGTGQLRFALAPNLPAGDYHLAVESSVGDQGWPFALELTRYPPLDPTTTASCATPRALPLDAQGRVLLLGTTAAAVDQQPAASCVQTPGPELAYRFHLDRPRGRSTFAVTSQAFGRWDTVLYLQRGDCAAPTPVACDDDGPGGVGTSEFAVDRLEAGDYTLYVDGYHADQSGTFLLRAALGAEL